MKKPIYADFMETDYRGRVVLNNERTFADLAANGFWFEEGLSLTFYTEILDKTGKPEYSIVEGVVEYDLDAERWVAQIDWSEIKSVLKLAEDEKEDFGFA